jgi:hypothetical protein
MIKLLTVAALAAAVAAPAFPQTVPSNAPVITVPVFVQTVPPPGGVIGAGPRQNGPVLPGTSSVPGPVFPSMVQKSHDTPSGHQFLHRSGLDDGRDRAIFSGLPTAVEPNQTGATSTLKTCSQTLAVLTMP